MPSLTNSPEAGEDLLQHHTYAYRADNHVTEIRELTSAVSVDGGDPTGRIEVVATDARTECEARFHAVITDVVGTPTELVTPDGRIARQERTTVWGTRLPAPPGSSSVDCPLRFPGQYRDSETDLNYNYFRYYDDQVAAAPASE
ncbi:hypothetical protein H3L99_29625 [Streptomyces pristinaespiralis]|uniref:Rhs protein n=2 Tax=Streptomyces pristinaespiralis TaxID=38300 RepID=B5HF09_STRE2|nr:type IV secretion protein Rhs [Streptomyces pristinaespiralis]EDY65420.1 rhs protein [Streptomyces pristinaespiralis ATCC 25486]QMU17255.1 hypothetical protein H3L99_29625 [Streptomyces pristinaespiralis]